MTTTWTTRGFNHFPQGKFGNTGQKLYVSRAGYLQCNHQCDLNNDGFDELTQTIRPTL